MKCTAGVLALALSSGGISAQNRGTVEQERREFAEWLQTAALSPRRAVGVIPIGTQLTLGPESAMVPLAGVAATSLLERDGRITLRSDAGNRTLARGRPFTLGAWHLLVSGPPGRTALTVFAAALRAGKPPIWYPYDPRAAEPVVLRPPPTARTIRVLAPDGVEVEATEAGSVITRVGGTPHVLRVLRLPGASDEETELEIYFQDATNDRLTYPAGRFVSLIPQADGRYLLDFNRARNPFCAYNTAYPCPAPWRGNALSVAVPAGEQYPGGGLSLPPRS